MATPCPVCRVPFVAATLSVDARLASKVTQAVSVLGFIEQQRANPNYCGPVEDGHDAEGEADARRKLLGKVQCCICRHVLARPATLPCGHVGCLACFHALRAPIAEGLSRQLAADDAAGARLPPQPHPGLEPEPELAQHGQQLMQGVLELKIRGTAAFKAGDLRCAKRLYTQALVLLCSGPSGAGPPESVPLQFLHAHDKLTQAQLLGNMAECDIRLVETAVVEAAAAAAAAAANATDGDVSPGNSERCTAEQEKTMIRSALQHAEQSLQLARAYQRDHDDDAAAVGLVKKAQHRIARAKRLLLSSSAAERKGTRRTATVASGKSAGNIFATRRSVVDRRRRRRRRRRRHHHHHHHHHLCPRHPHLCPRCLLSLSLLLLLHAAVASFVDYNFVFGP
eukprot:COSAG05_NODE_583_length_8532_cov_66.822365_3_plen_396_part_00